MSYRILNVGAGPLGEGHVELLTQVYYQLSGVLDQLPPDTKNSTPVIDAITNLLVHLLINSYGPDNTQMILRNIADCIPRSMLFADCVGTA